MKFVLLKFIFEGEVVDASVISSEDDYSFPVQIGDKEFDVYAEPIER